MATLEELVSAHGGALFRLASMLTETTHAAEDLYQETWVTAHRKWSQVGGADNPVAYLKRVMVNAYISQARKRSSTEVYVSDLSTVGTWPKTGPEEGYAERDAMWRSLSALPRAELVALVLHYYEDMTDRQAAEVIGCRPSTVRAHISRALTRLREQRLREGAP